MIHVMIVHQKPLFRAGLRLALELHEEFQIIGEFRTWEHVLEQMTARRPEVVLLDGACSSTCSVDGIVMQLRQAGAHGIIVFAPSFDEECLFRVMMSGAAACVQSTVSDKELVEKIRRVAHGEYLITSEVLQTPPQQSIPPELFWPVTSRENQADHFRQGQLPYDVTGVTAREIAVLRQIIKGRSNQQIGSTLKLSHQTVKNHIASIFKKMGARDRTQAVIIALRQGMISFDDARLCDLVLDRDALAQRALRFARHARTPARLQTSRSRVMAVNV